MSEHPRIRDFPPDPAELDLDLGEQTFEMTFAGEYDLAGLLPPSPPITVSVSYRARWWKRPWYWLRRKPTRHTFTFEDAKVGPAVNNDDGTTSFQITPTEKP